MLACLIEYDAALAEALSVVDGWWRLSNRQRDHELSNAVALGRIASRRVKKM